MSDHLNKRKIGAKSPSTYINEFKDENAVINKALNSHFIDLDGFGIESDDYKVFLQARAKNIYRELKARIDLKHIHKDGDKITELVLNGESETTEFKSTLRFDIRQKNVNKKLEYIIAKTIAAFMNCEGGNLLIGIDDNMNALGLDDDFSTLKKNNVDGFELQLIEIIKKYIGNENSSHVKISFPTYDNKQICFLKISKSSRPIFTIFEGREDFFIRSGCSSQPLTREEQSVYEKEHWK